MASFKKVTFLKVLTVIAWADGEITNSELNVLKSFCLKFGLDKDQIDELKPYFKAPLTTEEEEELFGQLIGEIRTHKGKEEIRQALFQMAEIDGEIHSQEKALIEQFEGLMESTSFGKRSLYGLKNLLTRVISKNDQKSDLQMESRFRRLVEKKFLVKSRDRKIKWSGKGAYLACLLGTLMASIAHSDDYFSDIERHILHKKLRERFDLTQEDITILCEIADEQGLDFDRYEITVEVNRLLNINDRKLFMECLFEIATADGLLKHEEIEELRNLTKALKISHKDFIACKVRYKSKIK